MSKTQYRNNMPPGLKAQIVIAAAITIGALLVLPTALSAGPAATASAKTTVASSSAGSVVTSLKDFHAASFAATSFTDWDD